jgi:hypothetical protein
MRIKVFSLLLIFAASVSMHAQNYMANNTILIVRHAEKPLAGSGLTPRGEARAQLYAKYFMPFKEGEIEIRVDSLYAGADSANSVRPRLTLEPLARASGLTLHHDIGTKDTAGFASYLRSTAHGSHPLISWRHGEIPELITALGGNPDTLFPEGKWPGEVFDWVVLLKTDGAGKVIVEKLIKEQLEVKVAP